MKRAAWQSLMVAAAAALSLGCSGNAKTPASGAAHTPGVPGTGGLPATGSGGMTMLATGGSGATPMTAGSSPMGTAGSAMSPAMGNAATGGGVAPPPVDAGSAAVADAGTTSTAGKLLPADNVDAMGPYDVTIDQNVGPNMGWIAHPTELGANGELHPIFSWGCGGGSQPFQYMDHLQRWASHGFVVEAHVSNGDGNEHKMIVDWLIAQNDAPDSIYYHKLDVTKIACGACSRSPTIRARWSSASCSKSSMAR